MRRGMISGLVIVCLTACEISHAQGLAPPSGSAPRPIVGATGGLRIPNPSQLPGSGTRVHLGPTGKPCVTVSAFSRSQTINPNIFDHMIFAQNQCSQPIKLKVCYYGSQSCVAVDVPGYGRRETVLGIYPAQRDFRYEYVEQF